MTPKMRKTRAKRVKYPTGLVARVQHYQNDTRTIRIEVEQVLHDPSRRQGALREGAWWVSGTLIPHGARGVCCHETLPTESFYGEKQAKAFAVKLYRHFAPHAA